MALAYAIYDTAALTLIGEPFEDFDAAYKASANTPSSTVVAVEVNEEDAPAA